MLACCYAGAVALVWALQDRMIFAGAALGRGAVLPAVPGVEVRRLELPDGGRFRVAVARPREACCGTVVVFTGNGEDLRSGIHQAALWRDYGQVAVVVEFPGYGDSEGVPSKASLFAAAEAAAAFAREIAAGRPVTAVGNSLGSFCAVHLAAQGQVDRLLLRAPPSSIERAGRERYPWLPVGWFLRHDFDSDALAPAVRCPVLVLHGDADRIVPLEHGRSLCERFAGTAELVVAAGYGHNDLPLDRAGPFGDRIAVFVGGN